MRFGTSGSNTYNIGSLPQNPTNDPDYNGLGGNDNITGDARANLIIGDTGSDVIVGNDGNDIIWGDEQFSFALFGGNDELRGGNGLDEIHGGGSDDDLYGDAGDDLLYGDAGVDELFGGSGADTLEGGDGSDNLYGGDDSDTLRGGFGQDFLYGEAGSDRLAGGMGNDVIEGGDDHDTILGDAGNDNLYGDSGNDFIQGGSGSDTINGGDGDDIIAFSGTGDGSDIVFGGLGIDRLAAIANDTDISLNIVLGAFETEKVTAAIDLSATTPTTFYSNVRLVAGAGSETVDLSNIILEGIAEIRAGAGNDTFTGSASADNIFGEDGDDVLAAGVGNGSTVGDTKNDNLFGGSGTDRAVYAGALGAYTSTSIPGGIKLSSATGAYEVAIYSDRMEVTTIATGEIDTLRDIESIQFSDQTYVFNRGPAPVTDTNAAANEVAENATAGTLVGVTASSTDPDPGDTITYVLTDDAGARSARR
jgi:serralysin